MKRSIIRTLIFTLAIGLITSGVVPLLSRAFAAANDGQTVKVQLNIANAQPRDIEETTTKSITREYSTAWKTLADALANNRPDRIGASFVGPAEDALRTQIDQQKKNGLSTRIVDRGHKLDVVFYSPEGSAMQLRDTAQFERQYLDRGKVVHSESITQTYMVVMAVTGDRWKVRVLQEQ
jgi:hypothetical protein